MMSSMPRDEVTTRAASVAPCPPCAAARRRCESPSTAECPTGERKGIGIELPWRHRPQPLCASQMHRTRQVNRSQLRYFLEFLRSKAPQATCSRAVFPVLGYHSIYAGGAGRADRRAGQHRRQPSCSTDASDATDPGLRLRRLLEGGSSSRREDRYAVVPRKFPFPAEQVLGVLAGSKHGVRPCGPAWCTPRRPTPTRRQRNRRLSRATRCARSPSASPPGPPDRPQVSPSNWIRGWRAERFQRSRSPTAPARRLGATVRSQPSELGCRPRVSLQLGKDPRTRLDLQWSGVRIPVDLSDPNPLDGVVELTTLALSVPSDVN